jgi:hypothetical protein
MKVFLSWSGHRSKLAASALNKFLPLMLHSISCWMSENDIPKGKPWFDELAKALNSIVFTIVCVTPENTSSPWLLWESGFLSSASQLGDRHTVPLAIKMNKESIGGPLSVYQATDTTREDMLRLLVRINAAVLEEKRITNEILERTFALIWPELEKELQAAANAVVEERPAPVDTKPVQMAEILGLLRQQQREGAEVKAAVERLEARANAPVLPGSYYVTPQNGTLTLGDYVSAGAGSNFGVVPTFVSSNVNSPSPLTSAGGASVSAFQPALGVPYLTSADFAKQVIDILKSSDVGAAIRDKDKGV